MVHGPNDVNIMALMKASSRVSSWFACGPSTMNRLGDQAIQDALGAAGPRGAGR